MRRRRVTWLLPLLLMAALLRVTPAHAAVNDGPCSGAASGDFNADGEGDLAVGVPEEDIGAIVDAGAVNIIYGSDPGGLTAANDQFLHQDSPNLKGSAEAGDRFGACLAAGDFDGDGADDLAIGVPGEGVNGDAGAGAISVIYGTPASASGGLSTVGGDQALHQDVSGIQGQTEPGDAFGGALAAGDFDNDGIDELAVGVPREDVGNMVDAGSVNILRGSENGLTGDKDQLWEQDSADIEDVSQADDKFGAALATGDFNNDNRDDLAVGVPEEDIGTRADAGAVNVLYGSATLLSSAGDQFWAQDTAEIEDVSESGDFFGAALAAGNFNGDAFGDLAIGALLEDVTVGTTAHANAGMVNVIYGSAARLSALGDQALDQSDLTASTGGTEAQDRFGSSLAAGQFDSGTAADLAIGAPGENTGIVNVGAVDVVYGGATGLQGTGGNFWTQLALADDEEAEDTFGSSLAAGNFNASTTPSDLAIGAPREDLTAGNAGAVNVVYGTGAGLSNADTQFWHQDVADIEDLLELNDMFGSAA